jgi:acyl-coenzyme A synthetase/AMP-(fatty) acid ligase
LESVLLTHPDIADVAVIGVESTRQATELPRAYIVHARAGLVKTNAEKLAFADHIQKWMQGKVARHMFLRGGMTVFRLFRHPAHDLSLGVVVIDAIPKRWVT